MAPAHPGTLTRLALAAAALALLAAGLWAPGQPGAQAAAGGEAPPAFVNVSRQAGVVNNRVVSLEMAVGQAWGDYDNDGWVDLYVTDPKGPNTLYRNNGDGTFSVSPLSAQVALPGAYSAGAVFVDFDNDGWRDLFVANWGSNSLFRNEAGTRFVEVSRAAGLTHSANSKTASWGDFDNDGFLDLYVANWSCYPDCGRPAFGDSDRLYHNNGDGTFTDVSDWLGGGLNGAGFVASFTDYDNDGDLDIYLVNDTFISGIGNKLWRNDGPGCGGWCFTQVAAQAGADSRLFGMGLAVGDYDNDGYQDFYYSNVGPMELLRNNADGTFTETALQAGVQAADGIGWGAVFVDYDNDGWRDLYLAVADTTHHRDIASNKLFRNNGDGTFSLLPCDNEAADVRPSLGVAYADYDRDGWVDLAVGNMDEGYRLFRNQAGPSSRNNWLALELVGAGPVNRDAVGARAWLTAPGGLSQIQEVILGGSLGAGNELALYFGLGGSQRADLTVRWPDGTEQRFRNVRANQRYRLEYPLHGSTRLQALAVPARSNLRTTLDGRQLSATGLLVVPAAVLLGLAFVPGLSNTRRWGGGMMVLGLTGLAAASVVLAEPGRLMLARAGGPDAELQYLLARAGARPPTNPSPPSAELIALGEALFWDPELSGNRDISCATCHHPLAGMGDDLSVSIGTGGQGLNDRRVRLEERRDFVPRNAQPIFNLGHVEWEVLFWDGRLSGRIETGIESPASDRLPGGLDSLLAAQAMFPITSRDEMRGLRGDRDILGQPNELAMLPDYAARPIWAAVMQRLLAIPEYVEMFRAAYPDVPAGALGFEHAANALAAYEIDFFTFEDSPFDRYLQGELGALAPEARTGALLFYGRAGCADCHSGPLLTDQNFHNLAVPQLGSGKGREQPFDFGRARETGNECDRFAFRTAPLRNVAITGPWMHNGAFTTLEGAVRHHLDPVASLVAYDPSQLSLVLRDTCQDHPETIANILATRRSFATEQAQLSDDEVQALLAFLHALTSPHALDLAHTIPARVPSGLPVGGNLDNVSPDYEAAALSR
jgi:cytochrome c peroxidase